jgi:hypothetical protein
MSVKSPNEGVRRAAGVIMWHLRRDHTLQQAVAKAEAHEPLLSGQEIGAAVQWAQAALLFADMLRAAPKNTDVCDLAFRAGLPLFEGTGHG